MNSAALLRDSRPPAGASAMGLRLPFQQMNQQHLQSALDRARLRSTQSSSTNRPCRRKRASRRRIQFLREIFRIKNLLCGKWARRRKISAEEVSLIFQSSARVLVRAHHKTFLVSGETGAFRKQLGQRLALTIDVLLPRQSSIFRKLPPLEKVR